MVKGGGNLPFPYIGREGEREGEREGGRERWGT